MTTGYVKPKNIKSVAAITEVFADGQKVTAVALEYDKNINNSKLSESTFAVEGRTITRVYANTAPAKALKGIDGRYVIIELSIKDKEASTIIEARGGFKDRKEIKVSVTRLGDIITTDGEKYPPDPKVIINDKEINPVVDDFLKLEFNDLKTGERLKYNLFIPKNYDRNKSYPMVVFISDRGSNGERHDMPLIQGIGGVIWATPSEQAKHECFVLVPQYPCKQIVFDDFKTSVHVGITVDLINSIVNQYSIDKNRIYTTGQSQGCMSSLEMGIRYPEMFAAMLLVAGQWDPRTVSVLARNKMWIVVSEGDVKAFPGMNAITASLEAAGAKISRAKWNACASQEEMASNVSKIIAEGNNIKYTVLDKGTVIPAGQPQDPGNHHVYTWKIVYPIEGLRDWLLKQVKTTK